MSTGNPPKGSAAWVAGQYGEEEATTYTPAETTATASAPKGSKAFAEQNTPEPTESKPTPQTGAAPAADNPAGVSAQNDANAGKNNSDVIGYDQQIATLQKLADKYKAETDEERKKRERKEKSQKIMAAVGDGLMALSNLYFTTKYAPNMYNHETMSQQTPLQKRLDEAKKEREANADKYLNYSLKIGDLNNAKAKTVREIEAQREAQKLAREKAQREQEQHGWLAALQPDKLREQAGKATKAEQNALTAAAEAENAPELYKAKVETEKARGKAQKASATASYAAAGAHNRSNVEEFYAEDENHRVHKFRSEKAAIAYAKQHGTYQETEVSTETDGYSDTGGHSHSVSTKKSGYARVTPKSNGSSKSFSHTRNLGL